MKKQTGLKIEVIKKGMNIKEQLSAEELKQIAAGRPPPQLGCGGPGACLV